MSNESTARSTLCYYFRLLGKESGAGWNSDNDSEIASIVEAIFSEINKLRAEVEELKAGTEMTMQPKTTTPQAQSQPTPAQGLRFESVERDGEQWTVEFTAGEYRYRYLASPVMSRLQLRSCFRNGEWLPVTDGPKTEDTILGALRYDAGLSLDWPTFRMGYEQFYCGYVAGWFASDEARL